MKFKDMLASENTDGQFAAWSAYRESLTSDIIRMIVGDATMQVDEGITSDAGEMKHVDCGDADKPTLAIWGAGGCNDIDLKRLSEYCKLVLIDCEKERCKSAIEKYGLDTNECVAADLYFYDIPHEQYIEFWDLLSIATPVNEVHDFLADLLAEAVSTDLTKLPQFEYSAVCGLASQLNSRLAAILYLNRDSYTKEELNELMEHIGIMDRYATRRLIEAVKESTQDAILLGYEADAGISANVLFEEAIDKYLGRCASLDFEDEIMWPFASEKYYKMKIMTLRI